MAYSLLNSEMLAKIINGSPIPSFVINKQHKVMYWNTAIAALSGIKSREIIGTDEQWRAFYGEKRPTMADLMVDGARENEIETYYRGKCTKSPLIDGAYEAEDFFPDLGQNGKWLNFTASPIRDNGGEVIGAIETLEDATERKHAEEALHESEKRFRTLFESAYDAIWVHDLEGNIQTANKAAAELGGYPVEELVGMNVKSFLSDESLKLAREVSRKLTEHQPIDLP
jgi:PAS domain-containing protein